MRLLFFVVFISFPIVADIRLASSDIVSIYDGDSFTVNIKEWPEIVGYRIPIRISGIDTPELRGKCQEEKELARLAKQFTVQALREAEVIELKDIQRGKYFRLIADVYLDGKNLSIMLLEANHARPYAGGKRESWCG
ncbi:thermonuclease family protein [Shewanella benthica]|uniref:thermonuclease family protein n=1 Tax=Shewanella benthica TaxID=43661 RepID=UPI00187B041C|nr:thermonuclease family protein [Shewanella benthica]MBE7216387.1 thermonuclease family protein [Shewanella benthica]MCL1065111.1 thermonuclease family protein [Shewanella benthica]